ncbi:MAG: hypothetical protein AMJ42_02125 [Deltaproteobacteria bacterium DG_8]|nr:MAG: hypothetical protein AMJ42_02125 [Deltaproteobacteria bacterium DG_8]
MKPFLGLKITSKLQEGLDKCNSYNKFYFEKDNPEFLQIITIDSDKYIGRAVEQGIEYKKIEDIGRNIISIIHKLCPDIPISIDSIKLLALDLFP